MSNTGSHQAGGSIAGSGLALNGNRAVTEPKVCKAAGDDRNHRRRKVGDDGYCDTCGYARKRARRRTQRLGTVRRSYGLSESDLDALVADQTGPDGKLRCRCGGVMGVTRSPCVDHDHSCRWCAGKGCRRCVRGLLHQDCNRFLGRIGDRPEALINLALHVVAMPAQAVLTALDRGDTMDTSAQPPTRQRCVSSRCST